MEIILDCKTCNNEPEFYSEDDIFVIQCCENIFKDKDRQKLIDEWNDENNRYEHVFGVIYEIDFSLNQIKKSLDGVYIYDSIIRKKSSMCEEMLNNDLFSCNYEDIKNIFPECIETSISLKGINMRKATHQPNYEIYKLSFEEKLERDDIQNLLNMWTNEELDKFKFRF